MADQPPLSERTHPYVVRMPLTLGSNVELEMEGDEAAVPFGNGYALRLVRQHTPQNETAHFQKRVGVQLDAFTSATEAERAGRFLWLSVLWFAASKRATIGFRRRTGDYPFAVRDRTIAPGMSAEVHGRSSFRITPEELARIAEPAFLSGNDPGQNVLISMEFFVSARLEATERARFIALTTALEALSEQREYGDGITELLKDLVAQVRSAPSLAGEANRAVRDSLAGRIRDLRRESVRQAIKRTIGELVEGEDVVAFIDEAYALRSRMLHEGHRADALPPVSARLEGILARAYSSLIGLPLEVDW